MEQRPGLFFTMFIHKRMKEERIKGIVELSQRSGVDQLTISGIVSGGISPVTKNGSWRKEVRSLAAFFECPPEALFCAEEDLDTCDDSRIQAEECFSHVRNNVLLSYAEVLNPERVVSMFEISRRQEEILACLTPQEKRAISLCFGFDGMGERTLGEVGKMMEITRTRVDQLKRKAIERLQRKSNLRVLHTGE